MNDLRNISDSLPVLSDNNLIKLLVYSNGLLDVLKVRVYCTIRFIKNSQIFL